MARASIIKLACEDGAAAGVVLSLHPFLKSLRRNGGVESIDSPKRTDSSTGAYAYVERAMERSICPLHNRSCVSDELRLSHAMCEYAFESREEMKLSVA